MLVARRTGRGACRLDWPRVRSSCLVLRGWEGGGHGWAWVGGWVGWVGVHVPDEGVGHGLEVMAGKQEAAQGRHVQVGQAALVGKAWRRLRVLYLGIGLVVLVPWGWSGHGASSKKGGERRSREGTKEDRRLAPFCRRGPPALGDEGRWQGRGRLSVRSVAGWGAWVSVSLHMSASCSLTFIPSIPPTTTTGPNMSSERPLHDDDDDEDDSPQQQAQEEQEERAKRPRPASPDPNTEEAEAPPPAPTHDPQAHDDGASSAAAAHPSPRPPRYCNYFKVGHCWNGEACPYLHEPCAAGLECADLARCRKGHPKAWGDKREYSKPCRFFRAGYCPRRATCRYQHVLCEQGLACQRSSCRLGHPPEWRCYGCHKCRFGPEGLTGAGVLLLTPSHESESYDVVLVEEQVWEAGGGREWGEMGGRMDGPEEAEEDEDGAVGEVEDLGGLAARELLEETAGTVEVAPAVVGACPYVDVGLYHRYRCFLLVVDKVSVGRYQEARKKPGLPRCYRETLDMRRFPLTRVVSQIQHAEATLMAAAAAEEGEGEGVGTGMEVSRQHVLMGEAIYSYKGKPSPVAERLRQVITAMYHKNLFVPYCPAVIPPYVQEKEEEGGGGKGGTRSSKGKGGKKAAWKRR